MPANIRDRGVDGFLLKDVSSDTDGNGYNTNGATMPFSIIGNLGGGSVTLQTSTDSGLTWTTLPKPDETPAVYTTPFVGLIDRLAAGMQIRATLAGSAGASGVYVKTFE